MKQCYSQRFSIEQHEEAEILKNCRRTSKTNKVTKKRLKIKEEIEDLAYEYRKEASLQNRIDLKKKN